LALRSPRVATAGAAAVIGLPLFILGPLRHSPPPWDAPHVTEKLTGQVIRNGTDRQQIVSFVGQAKRPQKLLVRADLLASPQSVESTSLQLEYLPSGHICRGHVTEIGGTSFTGTCRLPNGEARTIDASWAPSEQGSGFSGEIRLG
jgi:hypothetical protein